MSRTKHAKKRARRALPSQLAPMTLTSRQSRLLRRVARKRAMTIADVVREAINLAEQIEAGAIVISILHRDVFDQLAYAQARAAS